VKETPRGMDNQKETDHFFSSKTSHDEMAGGFKRGLVFPSPLAGEG
jgi:hypothetical protein